MTDILDGLGLEIAEKDCFDFCQEMGFSWIPAIGKYPRTKWRTGNGIFSSDDLQAANHWRKDEGIRSALIPTEENHLLVIDCDVSTVFSDERTLPDGRPKPQTKPEGLKNFVEFLKNHNLDHYLRQIDKNICIQPQANRCHQNHGQRELEREKRLIEDIALRAQVVTPSMGYHFYFRCEDPSKFKSCAGVIAPHVDIRAKGGLIAAPYSFRGWDQVIDGTDYGCELTEDGQIKKVLWGHFYIPTGETWIYKSIPELPTDLAAVLPKAEKEKAPQSSPPPVKFHYPVNLKKQGRAGAYVQVLLNELSNAIEGERNDKLNKLAGQAFRLSMYLGEGNIYRMFEQAGRSLGLPEDEIKTALNSAKKWADDKPKTLK